MSKLPHSYSVVASFEQAAELTIQGDSLPVITAAPPSQFGGPGDIWSPEDLQIAALSSCLILSFKAVALASGLAWQKIECRSEGQLDRDGRQVCFTSFKSRVKLTILDAGDVELARRLVRKADETCFISNSLKAQTSLEVEVLTTA